MPVRTSHKPSYPTGLAVCQLIRPRKAYSMIWFASDGFFNCSNRCQTKFVLGIRHWPSPILSCSQRSSGVFWHNSSVVTLPSKQPDSTKHARLRSNQFVLFMALLVKTSWYKFLMYISLLYRYKKAELMLGFCIKNLV